MDRLLVSLLNTAMERPDPLETPLGTARWWSAQAIPTEGKPRFDAALAEALRGIREALAAGTGAAGAGPLGMPFRGNASDGILFEVLHAARGAAAAGTLRRIRRCRERACGRYFCDSTKNRSKRWCSVRCMERARVPRRRTISR